MFQNGGWMKCCAILSLCLATQVNAQSVRVTVKPQGGGAEQQFGSLITPGNPVPINLSTVESQFPNGYDFIRIDSTSGVANVGVVQLSGTTSFGDVRLLIADSTYSAFPAVFSDPIFLAAWAAQNLAGIDTSALSSTDRDKVRLAASIAGDLTGAVSVGTVYSLAAAGTISGNITASRNDGLSEGYLRQIYEPTDDQLANQPTNYDYAIHSIRSNTGITGNISASNGSIRSLFVGPGENVAGLQGNFLALNGHIRNIDTKGPIGAANHIVDIVAGYGIRQIFVGFESGFLGGLPATDPTRPRNVYANIEAALSVGSASLTENSLGWARTVRISGNYAGGSFNTRTMRPEEDPDEIDTGGTKWGMFVDGTVDVPIHVRHALRQSSFVAANFLQPITIDVRLKGRIEATASNGHIERVDIAMDPNLYDSFDSQLVGFIGSERRPRWDNTTSTPRVDEPEGVIRAVTIGDLNSSTALLGNKRYPPRVEAIAIDSFRVGRLAGEPPLVPGYDGIGQLVVWSGVGSSGPNPALDNTYAHVGSISATRVHYGNSAFPPEYQTSLYVWDDFSKFEVLDYLEGRVFLPKLGTGKTIKIGCAQTYIGLDDVGFIRLRDTTSLAGQITIGASQTRTGESECGPNVSVQWADSVEIGTGTGAIVLSSFPTPPENMSPYYERSGLTLGTDSSGFNDGGAVGLLPYHLQRSERKLTAYAGDATPTELLQSEFSPVNGVTTGARQEVEMWWYGPVRVVAGQSGEIRFPCRILYSTMPDDPNPTDMSTMLVGKLYTRVRAGNDGPESRILTFGAVAVNNASQMFPPGYYYLRPSLDVSGTTELRCDGLLSNISLADSVGIAVQGNGAATTFADGDFVFRILPDCDLNLCPDNPATCPFGTECAGTGVCIADVDDGSDTGTPDGGVTIDDLLYYLAIYEAGGTNADVDDGSGTGTHDGGVTIDDLLFFINRFALGC